MAEYAYTKLRSEFGRQCSFSDRSVEVLANIRPSEQQAAEYIRRNPVNRAIQISSFEHYSEHYVSSLTVRDFILLGLAPVLVTACRPVPGRRNFRANFLKSSDLQLKFSRARVKIIDKDIAK